MQAVPAGLKRYGLSQIINHLLALGMGPILSAQASEKACADNSVSAGLVYHACRSGKGHLRQGQWTLLKRPDLPCRPPSAFRLYHQWRAAAQALGCTSDAARALSCA